MACLAYKICLFYLACASDQPVLPAAAIGKDMRLREAWRPTSELKAQILLLAGFEVLVYFGISAAVFWVSALIGAVVPAMILFLLQTWILTLYGGSILTTLYRYLIEKRALQGATHS